ncbi:tetratricopeptide repeat protein [Pigmentiphaga aceris]|uniref:tetratricopeptide repeat protein n=1 Tax=Pigmentiphaga aceris TaxID=1940612 RepID=UPI00165295D5|nr:tetratricopeptide repeat protein [Pigmentiphaga aceris]
MTIASSFPFARKASGQSVAACRPSRRTRVLTACAGLLVCASAFAQAPATEAPNPNLFPGLARALEHLKPSVDTTVPETAGQTATRIQGMLDRGENAQALADIDKFTKEDEAKRGRPGTNVQMLFLRGRALAQLGRRAEATAVYQDITERFPELPESWNNLASLQVADKQLELARDSLLQAVRNSPNYSLARENLGLVYLALASRELGAAGGSAAALKLQVDTLLRQQGR